MKIKYNGSSLALSAADMISADFITVHKGAVVFETQGDETATDLASKLEGVQSNIADTISDPEADQTGKAMLQSLSNLIGRALIDIKRDIERAASEQQQESHPTSTDERSISTSSQTSDETETSEELDHDEAEQPDGSESYAAAFGEGEQAA